MPEDMLPARNMFQLLRTETFTKMFRINESFIRTEKVAPFN